ncbi:hypothetical protein Trydic_g2839 [Trypoxylus dichotomus]
MDSKSKKKYGTRKKYGTPKQYTLGCEEKGFLCSCNGHEKECIKECCNILNNYAERLCRDDLPKVNVDSSQLPPSVNSSVEDIEADLQKEIAMLRSDNHSIDIKRFQIVDSGAKNFLFIRTTCIDPVVLATAIVKDIAETKQLQARHLIRLVPIETTCKAYIDNIKKACANLLEKHFSDGARTFSILYNHRNNSNNHLSRDVVIAEVAKLVSGLSDKHTVDLNGAEVTIVIEIIKSIALLAVIPDYLKYKKFNLHSLSQNT